MTHYDRRGSRNLTFLLRLVVAALVVLAAWPAAGSGASSTRPEREVGPRALPALCAMPCCAHGPMLGRCPEIEVAPKPASSSARASSSVRASCLCSVAPASDASFPAPVAPAGHDAPALLPFAPALPARLRREGAGPVAGDSGPPPEPPALLDPARAPPAA